MLPTSSRTDKLSRLEIFLTGLMFLFFFGPHLAFGTLAGPANVASYGILFFLIIKRWKRVLYVLLLDPLPLLLMVMAIASVTWSAVPSATALEFRAAVRSTLLGAYLATCFTTTEFMALLGSVIGIGAVLSLIAGTVTPDIAAPRGEWYGIFAHKNILSYIMTVGVLLSVHRFLFIKENKWKAIFLLLLSLTLLFLSQGKGAWASTCITLSLFPIQGFSKGNYKVRTAFYVGFIFVIGSAIVLTLTNLEAIVVDGLGKNLEFNGRIPIWQLMIEQGLKRPWLGYGYSGFWTADVGGFVLSQSWASAQAYDPNVRFNAHSAYVDTFLQFGFIGLAIFILSAISSIARLVSLLGSRHTTSENLWMLQSLLAMLLMAFSESFGSISATSHWSLFVYISLSSALQASRIRQAKKFQQTHSIEQDVSSVYSTRPEIPLEQKTRLISQKAVRN
jgi:exopolysaccharide production protein ExoQ